METTASLSMPMDKKETDLAILFEMPLRQGKPGRSLQVAWNEQLPIIEGMSAKYFSILRTTASGTRPGNHFHTITKEIYYVLKGGIKVILEHRETKKQERFFLSAKRSQGLYIRPGVAHVIVPSTESTTILVVTDNPDMYKDEFKYEIAN